MIRKSGHRFSDKIMRKHNPLERDLKIAPPDLICKIY